MSNEIGDVVSARADEDPRDRSSGAELGSSETAMLGGAALEQKGASVPHPHTPFTAEAAAANRLLLMQDPGHAKRLEQAIAVTARKG